MQEVGHSNKFCWNSNKSTQIIPERSFYDVLSLNSTNLLMLRGNVKSYEQTILCAKN